LIAPFGFSIPKNSYVFFPFFQVSYKQAQEIFHSLHSVR
jgi:hypothetical protein